MMHQPSFEEIQQIQMQGSYDIFPVYREIQADTITPITLLQKVACHATRYCLLESVEAGLQWGRYSFFCIQPLIEIICENGTVQFTGQVEKTIKTNQPLAVLREHLKKYRAPQLDGYPPFTGGLVGQFSYDMIRYGEPTLSMKQTSVADFDLLLFDQVIVYDHLKQTVKIIVNMYLKDDEEGYRKACEKIDKITEFIRAPYLPPFPVIKKYPKLKSNISKKIFFDMVRRAKKYIVDGDIFQVVLSRRWQAPYQDSLCHVYRMLRTTNPSPYMFYFKTETLEIAGTSPETLVKLNKRTLSTFPMAGTRRRGENALEDSQLEQQLLSDEKELAEHHMLVDLARNDVGKISEFSSVKVKQYCKIHRYSKVMHMTSQVDGTLKTGLDAFDAIQAILPAGTLSGAPKIRACEIIDELENHPREIYGGAVGYIDFSGDLDVCIAIRMVVQQRGQIYVQAGAGIVADSVETLEYEETKNKASAMLEAINRAAEVEK